MNRIRNIFVQEVEELLPVLHKAYRLVGAYQKRRNERNAQRALAQIEIAAQQLQFFKDQVPVKKQVYFDAALCPDLSISDRIVAFDVAIGAMHIVFPVARAYSDAGSAALRKVLDACRYSQLDRVVEQQDDTADVLVRGIPASPGLATGQASIVRTDGDYGRLPPASIVVAEMTRPEMIFGIRNIAGIVTDIGGRFCHAAIVANEMGIPCVVGTERATAVIRDGDWVSVDGARGIVTRVTWE